MINTERVVITGLGAVSGFGIGCNPLWANLSVGHHALYPIQRKFENHEINTYAALIPEYIPHKYFNNSTLTLADPFTQYAAIAAREAMQEADLWVPLKHPERCAIILGTGEGGSQTREEACIKLFHLRKKVHPLTVPRINQQASASLISAEYGITGPCFSISSGCTSAGHAIAQAWLMIKHGIIDIAITGGSEACAQFGLLCGFDALQVLSKAPCSPFSLERSGMSLGEGAGVIIIEGLSSALARKANILAELAGVGMTSDATNSLHPTVNGPVRAMKDAMLNAKLLPIDIGYINAHGTGTIANDATEASAINIAFDNAPPPVSSTKSLHGHTLGAAAGLEVVVTVLAMKHQLLPPTANFKNVDPACILDCTPNQPRKYNFKAALSNSFAFGGLNVVIAIKQFDER